MIKLHDSHERFAQEYIKGLNQTAENAGVIEDLNRVLKQAEEKGQLPAAVQAIMGKAKVSGELPEAKK